MQVEMGGCKAPITTFIVEPFVPHDQEYYLSIVSERLGSTISFSECGGIEIEENWDKVKTVFLPTEKAMTPDACAPLIATLPLEVRLYIVSPSPCHVVFFLTCWLFSHSGLNSSSVRTYYWWYLFWSALAILCSCHSRLLSEFQVRTKIGDFIRGVYSVFQGNSQLKNKNNLELLFSKITQFILLIFWQTWISHSLRWIRSPWWMGNHIL